MKIKALAVLALAVGLAVGLTGPAAADDEGTVTATVTAEVISITVSPTDVAYGSVALGSTDNVPTPGSFTATNNGNVAEDFTIKGAPTAAWSLVTTAPGIDEYRHWASSDGFSTEQALTTSYAGFTAGTTPTNSETVSLKLDAPSSTAATAQQNANVTVLATAS